LEGFVEKRGIILNWHMEAFIAMFPLFFCFFWVVVGYPFYKSLSCELGVCCLHLIKEHWIFMGVTTDTLVH
jgi:hypothetical protein